MVVADRDLNFTAFRQVCGQIRNQTVTKDCMRCSWTGPTFDDFDVNFRLMINDGSEDMSTRRGQRGVRRNQIMRDAFSSRSIADKNAEPTSIDTLLLQFAFFFNL